MEVLRGPARVLLAATVACSPAMPAAAQDRPDLSRATLEQLMNVAITTASRSSETAADAPARVTVITSAQIERRGYRSLADLLKDLADVKVEVGADQDYPTELVVQGMRGASRVIVLLDGVRVSSPTNEPLPILANYPVHSARQVEVVYGPVSALYGADAFSAVINIISKTAQDGPGATVSASAGQYGLFNETGSLIRRFGTNGSVMVAAQLYNDAQPDLSRYYPGDFGGLVGQHTGAFSTIYGPMTSARPVSPAFSEPISAHSLQASLHLGAFQFTVFQSHDRTPSSSGYTPDNAVYNPDAFMRNTLFVGSGSYTRRFGGATGTTTVTFSRHVLDPHSGYWNVYSNFERSYKFAFGQMTDVTQQFALPAWRGVRATSGITFQYIDAIPQGADLNSPVVSRTRPGTILDTPIVDDFVNLRERNVGAYVQAHCALTSLLTLTGGVRADYHTRYGGTFNPRLGLVFRPRPSTTAKVLFGTAFLAPSPYEAYAHYGSFYSLDGGRTYRSEYWHVGNPDLKPQHKQTVEADLSQELGTSVNVSVSAFYSHFSSVIQGSDPDRSGPGSYHGWPVAYVDFPINEGSEWISGATSAIEFIKRWDNGARIEARAAVSLADGRSDEEPRDGFTLPIGGMSPIQARFGLDADYRDWTLTPRLVVVGTQRVIADTVDVAGHHHRETLPGYPTLDLHVRRAHLWRNVDGVVTIENALDRRYRNINVRAYTNPEELVGTPQNPRRIAAGVTVHVR